MAHKGIDSSRVAFSSHVALCSRGTLTQPGQLYATRFLYAAGSLYAAASKRQEEEAMRHRGGGEADTAGDTSVASIRIRVCSLRVMAENAS